MTPWEYMTVGTPRATARVGKVPSPATTASATSISANCGERRPSTNLTSLAFQRPFCSSVPMKRTVSSNGQSRS